MKYLKIFMLKKLFTLYLEFKFNWVSCILYGNTSPSAWELIYHEYVCIYHEYIYIIKCVAKLLPSVYISPLTSMCHNIWSFSPVRRFQLKTYSKTSIPIYLLRSLLTYHLLYPLHLKLQSLPPALPIPLPCFNFLLWPLLLLNMLTYVLIFSFIIYLPR